MKCASCAAENPAGARYCSQCGAEQALPTPIAAVAAAVSGQRHASVARAANAARADLPDDRDAEPVARPNVVVAASIGGPRNAPQRQPRTHADAAPAQPAYARGPSNGHLAAFLIVLAFAIAAVAFGAWKLLGGEFRPGTRASGTDQSVMSSFPPEATPLRRPPPGTAESVPSAPSAASPPPPAASAPPSAASQQPSEAAATPEASRTTGGAVTPSQPIEIRPLPAKPAPRPAHRRAAPEKTQQAARQPVAEAPATTPERAAEVATAPTAAPPPVVDRWTRMTDELSRCTREDFIARVICDQRVRFRYCNGYWGRVPQCPGNPAPERGQ